MFLGPAWTAGHRHFAVCVVVGGLGERRAGEVGLAHLLDDVHLRGVYRHRHLIGLRIELGEHVARVVGQPLGGGAFSLRCEGDRAAHLQDHVGHRDAQASEQLVELGQALRALAV